MLLEVSEKCFTQISLMQFFLKVLRMLSTYGRHTLEFFYIYGETEKITESML